MEEGERVWKRGERWRRERGCGREVRGGGVKEGVDGGVMRGGGREGVEGEHSKALTPVVLYPCV